MSTLSNALHSSEFVVTSELTPPKGLDLAPLLEKAALLKPYVSAINLTESHAARMAMDPVAVGHLMLDQGVEPIVQMTSRDKNRLAIQASILGACALGISNLVFMGGDPPKNGDHPDAKPVFDLFASQLLEAVRALNNGADLNGNTLNQHTEIFAGAVVNPGATDPDAEIENLHRKIDGGAEFFQTQAVYDGCICGIPGKNQFSQTDSCGHHTHQIGKDGAIHERTNSGRRHTRSSDRKDCCCGRG